MTDATDANDGAREHELPNGDLAVAHLWVGATKATTVDAEDRPLYELLCDIIPTDEVPDLMPAHIARTCDDLVDARDTLGDVTRGSVDLDGGCYGMGYCRTAKAAIVEHRDRDPLTLVAVGCSSSKHHVDNPVPAADLYKSAYWTCKQEYGENVGDQYRILSAKHDVLHPEREIDHYDRSVDDLEGIPVDRSGRLPDGREVQTLLDEWALRVYNGLQTWIHEAAGGVDAQDVELEVLLGRNYRSRLEDRGVFEALRGPGGVSVSFPFQEVEQAQGGNGNQMGWMTDEVDRVEA